MKQQRNGFTIFEAVIGLGLASLVGLTLVSGGKFMTSLKASAEERARQMKVDRFVDNLECSGFLFDKTTMYGRQRVFLEREGDTYSLSKAKNSYDLVLKRNGTGYMPIAMGMIDFNWVELGNNRHQISLSLYATVDNKRVLKKYEREIYMLPYRKSGPGQPPNHGRDARVSDNVAIFGKQKESGRATRN
ncbi:MAG: hypothetical protein LBT80_03665 [Lactobacillaceae bacterium]|jgi:hypothetical protein|nr:hypothetical protein [Lactobacillaceae bacterium]